jgi:putative transposase
MIIATFRFGLISEFVTGANLLFGEKEKLLSEKVEKSFNIPFSIYTRISKSTLKKWISDYKNAGSRIEGLFPKERKDKGEFRSLDESLQLSIKKIKNEEGKENLTGVALVNELKHRKYIGPGDKINLSVIYKFLQQNNLLKVPQKNDRRSFEASFPNELWQSDILHGPMVNIDGPKNKKSYLIAILDDNSRLIPHGEFYLSEKLVDFKDCLKKALEKRGLPQRLYIDNGACYKALNLEQVTASLGIGITHTPPYKPQGRGKIERWFRYVRENFLPTCSKNISLKKLNEKFDDWVENYHNKIHGTTKETPLKRYQKNMKCVRPVPSNILDYFRFIEFRRVKKDRTFRLNGVVFEAPFDLIDERIEVRFHKEAPDIVEIFLNSNSFGFATIVDRNVNFYLGRNQKIISENNPVNITSGELF